MESFVAILAIGVRDRHRGCNSTAEWEMAKVKSALLFELWLDFTIIMIW